MTEKEILEKIKSTISFIEKVGVDNANSYYQMNSDKMKAVDILISASLVSCIQVLIGKN